jgi:hypothetical protein
MKNEKLAATIRLEEGDKWTAEIEAKNLYRLTISDKSRSPLHLTNISGRQLKALASQILKVRRLAQKEREKRIAEVFEASPRIGFTN